MGIWGVGPFRSRNQGVASWEQGSDGGRGPDVGRQKAAGGWGELGSQMGGPQIGKVSGSRWVVVRGQMRWVVRDA